MFAGMPPMNACMPASAACTARLKKCRRQAPSHEGEAPLAASAASFSFLAGQALYWRASHAWPIHQIESEARCLPCECSEMPFPRSLLKSFSPITFRTTTTSGEKGPPVALLPIMVVAARLGAPAARRAHISD